MILQYFAGFKLDLGGLVTSATITGGDSSAGVIGARVSGTLGRPGNAALYLNSLLPLALGSYLIGKPVDKRLALGAFSLGVVALIETSSRAGWISFAVAILILLSRVLWTEAGRKALLFVLLGALSVGILFGGQIYERTSTIKNVRSREQLAVMAHNIMEDYPLGIGENTYDLYMSDEYAHPAWVGHRLYPPHNKYLMIQTELGPQGLFAFALLLIAAAWQGRHWMLKANVDPEWAIVGAGFLGGFAAHLIQNQSETFTSRPQVQAFWFVVAMIVVIRRFIDRTEMIAAPVHSGKRKMQLDEPPSHMAGRP